MIGRRSQILDLIGQTPLLELEAFTQAWQTRGRLFGKLEFFNPAGSVKDRVARALIEAGRQSGQLSPGGTLVEPTSGNTGIGLACIGRALGYKVILTMPETMSLERRILLEAYGAEVVLTHGAAGMQGAMDRAMEIVAQTKGAYMPQQFANPANPQVHEATTGPELDQAMVGQLDAFVAGIGTGGTLTGVGRYLKKHHPKTRVIGVEPAASPLISQGWAGPHGLQGIGANFIPENLDLKVVDQVLTVKEDQALTMCRSLRDTMGLLIGISAGAALWGALTLAQSPAYADQNIVVLLPDGGERYLSVTAYGRALDISIEKKVKP